MQFVTGRDVGDQSRGLGLGGRDLRRGLGSGGPGRPFSFPRCVPAALGPAELHAGAPAVAAARWLRALTRSAPAGGR